MRIKQNKDGTLSVTFSEQETIILQLELIDLSDKYHSMAEQMPKDAICDLDEFPLVLTNFANAYVGGILQYLDVMDEPVCTADVFDEST